MKFDHLLALFILSFFSAPAQNLIVNPSFELFDNCPESFNPSYKKNLLPGWTSPTSGTPDYFNECSKGSVGMPENWAGYCVPREGVAYMGLYLFKEERYREFIQGSIKTPLKKGETYVLSLDVSPSINSEYHTLSFGCLLIKNKIEDPLESGLSFVPEESQKRKRTKKYPLVVEETSDTDLLNIPTSKGQYLASQLHISPDAWQHLEFEFIAEQEAKYLILGNFTPLSEIKPVNREMRYHKESMLDKSSYLLIDNVSLVSKKPPIIDTPKTEPFFILGDLNFEFSSAKIKPSATHLLDSLYINFLSKNNLSLMISGHTDDIGSVFYNDELSRSRAQNVADYLISVGVNPNRINILGMGELEPIKENNSDKNRATNRRVEIEFLHQSTD